MNNSERNPPGGERGNPSATERDRTRNTPGTDMQAEDAGTPASGCEPGDGKAAQPGLQQGSKTPRDSGSRR